MAVTRVGVTLLSQWFIGDAMVTSRRVDPEDLAALPELGSQRERDHAAGKYRKYFVSDVAFEAANDIAIGESFGGVSGDLGHGLETLMAFAQHCG